jgi:rubrerythrin
MSDTTKKVAELVGLEKKHALSLLTSVEGLKNIVVRELLKGISHDSRKHAGFYEAILSLLKVESPALTQEDFDKLEEIIKNHIKSENLMMLETKQLLESTKDSRIKSLLTEIYEDEIKHHTLMKRLLDIVIRRETVFEMDVWEWLWRGVPGHGAPIGS